jgi:hypothetical protein
MSRSWDQFHYTRGGDCGGEYTSHRAGMRYPVAGRFTKTLTHRIERHQARRELAWTRQQHAWAEERPVLVLEAVYAAWDSDYIDTLWKTVDEALLDQIIYWHSLYTARLGDWVPEYRIVVR